MREIFDKISKFNNERDWDQFHSPENLAKSISIEAGELLECFQWSPDFRLSDVRSELSDILIYSIILAEKLDLNIKEIIDEKIEENKRKYPIDKSKGLSKKYTEF